MYGAIAPIYVLYARPFTKCYGVEPFSRDDLVPDEFRELHDNNIALRNQAYGHRDAKGVELKQGMLLEHEVYMILKSEGEMAFAHSEPRSGVRVFQGINKLVAKLIETCQHKLVELKNSTGHHLPKLPGRYKLNITDETGPMWVRCTEEANWKHPPICAGGWVSIAEN